MELMQRLDDIRKDIWQNHRALLLVLSAFTVLQLIVVKTVWNQPPIWDASVYIGMGKRLFSGWQYGIWELFRPLMLPVILGSLWKIGVPMIGIPYLLSSLTAIIGLVATYYFVEKIKNKRIALYTTGIIASTSVFFKWSFQMLTGIPSSFLILAAAYKVSKKENFSAGLLNSAAFLTRFPSAIVGPSLAVYLFLKDFRQDLRLATKNAAYYTAGFFLLATPFFVFNKSVYGNFLEPIFAGASVPLQSNPEKFFFGLYYIKEAIIANPLLALAPLGIGLAIYNREKVYGTFIAAFTGLYLFFTAYQHKDPRFMLIFLPLMSMMAARGLSHLQDYSIENTGISQRIFTGTLISLFILLISVNFGVTLTANQWSNEHRIDFLNEAGELEGTIAGNDPVAVVYGDFEYVPLRPENLNQTYGNVEGDADYYIFNSGAWYCSEAIPRCDEKVSEVVQEVEKNHRKIFESEGYGQTYNIYEVVG